MAKLVDNETREKIMAFCHAVFDKIHNSGEPVDESHSESAYYEVVAPVVEAIGRVVEGRPTYLALIALQVVLDAQLDMVDEDMKRLGAASSGMVN